MDRRRFLLLVAMVIVLGTALQAPSLRGGYLADDYVHLWVLEGKAPVGAPLQPWSLFDFGRLSDWQALDSQAIPIWWTSPDWQVRFFRPLSSASLWLDHALFGAAPVPAHLESLAWYALLLLLVAALLRSLGLKRPAVLVATSLYACCNGAAMPVGWLANRSTLLASVATVAAVLVLVRGRSRWRLVAAFLLAAAAAVAKESGVAAFALVAAWLLLETRGEGGSGRRRWAVSGAVAALATALAYVAGLALAGMGTRSWFYATPWREPLRYLGHLGVLATAGLLRLLAPVPLDLGGTRPALAVPMAAVGALLAWPVAALVWRSVREHPAAPFLAAWLPLTLLVEGSPPPSDRLLLLPAVASAGLLGQLVYGALRRDADPEGAGRRRALAWVLVLVTGVLGGGFALLMSQAGAGIAGHFRRQALATDVGVPGSGCRDAVVLQAGDMMLPFVLPQTWQMETGRTDVRFAVLQMGRRGLEWTREDARTCLFRSTGRPFLTNLVEKVYRSGPRMPAAGETFRTPLFDAEIAAGGADGPTAVRLRFSRSLDSADLCFLAPGPHGRLVGVPPPPVGAFRTLPEASRDMRLVP